jgi:acetyl esterase/lipase
MHTIRYGPASDHVGDLYLPRAARAPVICLLHGGFWRMPWGREHIAPIAGDLARRGFAVWNLEYRRMADDGSSAGGWPATCQDVAAGVDHLASLEEEGVSLNLSDVTVIGHSAGGHLSLWSAQRRPAPRGSDDYQPRRVRITAAVGLAPVADLALAYELRCGRGAVERFLGGSPSQLAARYLTASPAEMVPLGVKQLLIHGALDEDVPVEISRRYVHAARAAGDDVDFIELPGAAHMDFIDPASEAHAALCRWLSRERGGR